MLFLFTSLFIYLFFEYHFLVVRSFHRKMLWFIHCDLNTLKENGDKLHCTGLWLQMLCNVLLYPWKMYKITSKQIIRMSNVLLLLLLSFLVQHWTYWWSSVLESMCSSCLFVVFFALTLVYNDFREKSCSCYSFVHCGTSANCKRIEIINVVERGEWAEENEHEFKYVALHIEKKTHLSFGELCAHKHALLIHFMTFSFFFLIFSLSLSFSLGIFLLLWVCLNL